WCSGHLGPFLEGTEFGPRFCPSSSFPASTRCPTLVSETEEGKEQTDHRVPYAELKPCDSAIQMAAVVAHGSVGFISRDDSCLRSKGSQEKALGGRRCPIRAHTSENGLMKECG